MLTLFMPDFASVSVIQCSPPSWMVQIALHEKSVPHTVRRISYARGEHRTPEMLARNPRGTVPVLGDDATGVFLSETFAMLEWLEFGWNQRALLPEDVSARAVALDRLHETNQLKRAGMSLFAYLMRHPTHRRGDPDVDSLVRSFLDELDVWEARAAHGHWLAGESFSLADIAAFSYIACAQWLGLTLERTHPALDELGERVRARRSIQETWPETWHGQSATSPLTPGGW